MTSALEYRAAIFDGPGAPFRIARFAMPALRQGEVLVRIACCTLCGSDLHTHSGRRTSPAPSILGHEVTGIVEDFARDGGAIVDYSGEPVRRGDRITWSLAVSCGECRLCIGGLPQKCESVFKYGHETFCPGQGPHGGLSEYCVLRAGTAILQVPAAIPDAVAATANCAAATVMAAVRTAGPLSGSTVLIQGAGMLGLTAIAVVREAGATVIVTDPDPVRLRHAAAFGATDGRSDTREVLDITGGRGVDVAFEFSGDPAAAEGAIAVLGIGARYILSGAVFPARPAAIDIESIVRKMVRLAGVHNYAPHDLAAALEFLARHHARYPFDSLIARRFGLDEADEAFDWAARERAPRVAIVPRGGDTP